jgi:hypothetical protein
MLPGHVYAFSLSRVALLMPRIFFPFCFWFA